MKSAKLAQQCQDYYLVEKALCYLEAHWRRQPSLEEIASDVGLSPYHFHRLFGRWAGLSPKRFLQFLTVRHAKSALERSKSVLEASYEAGLSSPGRLHDLFVVLVAVTPGEYKKGGAGTSVRYGFHDTPFGACLLATTSRGICSLSFHLEKGEAGALEDLQGRWPGAALEEDPAFTSHYVQKIFCSAAGGTGKDGPLKLHVKGTNFQVQVWEALLRIPQGNLLSYEDVAASLGNPRASRAVAGAVAQNPVSYLIPCHRVIRKTGVLGEYRWGSARKKAILGREAAATTHAEGSFEEAL